jgi:type II secretory pathway pseudopilin PulG
MSTVLIVIGILSLVGGVIYLAWLQDKKRREALQAAAQALGFTYTQDGSWEQFLGLPIFERGRSRKARNVLDGTTAGHVVTLMDFQYTIGSGKNSQTHHQSIAIFPQSGQGLPDFELGPENFLHKIGQVFGYQDIDFPEDEEFSKRFLLRGEDEAGIRATFNGSVRAASGNFEDWSVQCRGGRIAVFRASRRCKPEEIPSFLANGLRIVSALGQKS